MSETARTSAAPAAQRDPFLTASLLLVGDGMAADELAARLQPLAGGDLAASRSRLEEMVKQGLLQVERENGTPAYAPTDLGRTYVQAVLQGQQGVLRELASLETMRTEVLAAIAHEFRTPLTAIRTAVGL